MTNDLTELQEDVLRVVMDRTSAGPVTGRSIASIVGMKKRRSGKEGADLRAVVNALRRKGYPICATGEGYWWPRDDAELSGYIVSLQGRINEQQEACDGMKKGFALILKKAKELAPGRSVTVRWEEKVYMVTEGSLEDFLLSHPGAHRV